MDNIKQQFFDSFDFVADARYIDTQKLFFDDPAVLKFVNQVITEKSQKIRPSNHM